MTEEDKPSPSRVTLTFLPDYHHRFTEMPLGLATLPVELVDTIAKYAAKQDLLSLTRTDRRTHGVCLRWIYRVVILDDRVRAIGCFKVLTSNICAAQYVRGIIIHLEPSSGLMLKAFARLMRAAFQNLTYLDDIGMNCSAEILGVLCDIQFPRLRQCAIPFSADTFPFLRLHPNLVQLLVDPVPDIPVVLPPRIRSTTTRSRTSHVILFWDPAHETPPDILFKAIADSGTEISEVHNVVGFWDITLLTAITTYIPTLSSLSIRNVSSLPGPVETEQFLACIDETLKSLTSLSSLFIIRGTTHLGSALDTDDLDREFKTVRRWSDISPALRCCILPSQTRWTWNRNNVWYPGNYTDSPAGLLARFQWFIITVISSSALPPAYSAVLEVIGGKEMVSALREAFERDGVVPSFRLAQLAGGISMTLTPEHAD
ncbi:hypothetical protein MVEN_01745900 [Mycena venus]|uniref:F-box domain-containing protein n=1 Tax=Mycena venus TaxID=2733690 RepID=A0A8H7CP67_9AGAR|nr:hypothetical protein MVEN_01745900 [Mycena venus]